MNRLKRNNNAKRWVKDKVNKILEPIVSIILRNGMLITAIHSRFEKKKDFVESVTIHGRNLNKKIRSAYVQSNALLYGIISRWLFTYLERNLEEYIKTYNERILDLVDLVREKQKRVMSITLANLITLDVHKENAMKNLLVKGAKRINEFDWIAAFNRFTFS